MNTATFQIIFLILSAIVCSIQSIVTNGESGIGWFLVLALFTLLIRGD